MLCFLLASEPLATKWWILICIGVAIAFFFIGFIVCSVFVAGARQDEIMEKWSQEQSNVNAVDNDKGCDGC